MTDSELPVVAEPFTEDDDFFPDKKPEGYPAFHNYRRDREAARLKAMNWDLLDIAAHLQLIDHQTGEPDPRRAAKAVRRGLAMVHQFTTDEKRTEQLHSLELMKRHLWSQLDHEHILVQQGRVVFHNEVPLTDRRFALEAIDRIVRIEERQAKLLGLDATQRLSIEADQIGGEITSLIALLGQSDTAVERIDELPALGMVDRDD